MMSGRKPGNPQQNRFEKIMQSFILLPLRISARNNRFKVEMYIKLFCSSLFYNYKNLPLQNMVK